ncbi:hypothetical protein [Pedobacter suwonensis]|nr:hypothetical protein [Pedobacter suwonensis]
MSNILISVKNLTKQYQAEQAGGIRNVSFDIKKVMWLPLSAKAEVENQPY